MKIDIDKTKNEKSLSFYGGIFGAIFPFLIFVAGVIFIALSGAPDERGFWPVLFLALGISLLLAKDKNQFSQTVINGMSEPIVMIMITAWILASTIGVLMTITGFVEALTWLASQLNLGGVGFVISTFIICCIVSLSTGSSFATILICSPILYPSGGLVGAHLPTLAGAIIGGATFGDFFAPISDTTIASALSQKAKIGPTVRSRLKYIIPAVILALIGYFLSATFATNATTTTSHQLVGNPKGLPMLLVPALIIFLFLKGKHLLHGLLLGLMFGVVLGLVLGLLPLENQLVEFAKKRSQTQKHAEGWIAGTVGAAVLLTTHSVVAILMVSQFANKTGERMHILPQRRANILSLVVCVFPFLLPYFIPVILMANTTSSGAEFDIPAVTPLEAGMYNFVAWGLLLMTLLTLLFGYGRTNSITKN